MQNQYIKFIVLIAAVCSTTALVLYEPLSKIPYYGCMAPNKKELKVGEYVQLEETCGVLACENLDGQGMKYICVKPPTYLNCKTDAVVTNMPFPECCWLCADYKTC